MRLIIKNMVCARCIRTVHRIAEHAGLNVKKVQLGFIEVAGVPSKKQLEELKSLLVAEGFELLSDRNSKIIEQVKTLIINEIHHQAGKKPESMNYSSFLSGETHMDYTQLSRLFSSVEGQTIEHYIIAQKIERIKELLIYEELTLSEISFQMGYSSSHHLSNQFKQHTGLTPTAFKSSHLHHRKHLHDV